MRPIHVVNQSTVAAVAQELPAVVAALQEQCNAQFSPLWNIWASLTAGTSAPAAVEQIVLLDDTDQADALGYHERTAGEVPIGFVFVKTAQANGVAWSAVLSHELLEQLADPLVNLQAQGTYQGQPAVYFYEACDPVENDTYTVSGVTVSNFVTPWWFLGDAPQPPAGSRFDYLRQLQAPFTMSPGGYVTYATVIGQWQQAFGQLVLASLPSATRYSRHGRRLRRLALAPKLARES